MRKERVLHARIPAELDRELKQRSARLGLSVSTVVRNVLMNTFDLVEGIVADSADLARVLRGAPPVRKAAATARAPEHALPESVVGWQALVLNVNAVCDQCNAPLARGTHAAVGVPIATRPSFLCRDCVAILRAPRAKAPRAGRKKRSRGKE